MPRELLSFLTGFLITAEEKGAQNLKPDQGIDFFNTFHDVGQACILMRTTAQDNPPFLSKSIQHTYVQHAILTQ